MNYADFSENERKFYLQEAGFDSREEKLFRLRAYDEKTLWEASELMGYSPRTIDRINKKIKQKLPKLPRCIFGAFLCIMAEMWRNSDVQIQRSFLYNIIIGENVMIILRNPYEGIWEKHRSIDDGQEAILDGCRGICVQYSGRLRTICHWYSQRYFRKPIYLCGSCWGRKDDCIDGKSRKHSYFRRHQV